jgi:exopolysaccharide production protein ExoY
MTPAVEQVFAPSRTVGTHPLRAIYRLEPAIAAFLLLIAAPAILVVAAIIAVLSRRTPLVRHRRVGWRGAELPMLKLRTMWEPKQAWAPVFAIENISDTVPANKANGDDRVSSGFAAWCRRYSIDELPQLYHVARGQMSLVGPRPITRAELEEHYGGSSEAVLTLRPGLTGLWQVMGRSRCTYAQRRRLDVWLSRHASPKLYLQILLRSIPGVLQGHDAY